MAAVSWSHGRIAKGGVDRRSLARDLSSPTDSRILRDYQWRCARWWRNKRDKHANGKRRLNLRPSACKKPPIVRSAQSDRNRFRRISRFVLRDLRRRRWAPQNMKRRTVHNKKCEMSKCGFPGPGDGPTGRTSNPLYMWITISHLIVHEEISQRGFSESSHDGTLRRIWVSNRHNLFWI